jgi:hemerythrin
MSVKNLIDWTEELSVGIQELDEQHKVLIELLNRLHEALITRTDILVINDILSELMQYTIVHFAVEESLMRILDYPLYEEHKKYHGELTNQVVDLQTKAKKREVTASMQLWRFLRNWLTRHILVEDKKYTHFFLERGLKKTWTQRSWKEKIWNYVRG